MRPSGSPCTRKTAMRRQLVWLRDSQGVLFALSNAGRPGMLVNATDLKLVKVKFPTHAARRRGPIYDSRKSAAWGCTDIGCPSAAR